MLRFLLALFAHPVSNKEEGCEIISVRAANTRARHPPPDARGVSCCLGSPCSIAYFSNDYQGSRYLPRLKSNSHRRPSLVLLQSPASAMEEPLRPRRTRRVLGRAILERSEAGGSANFVQRLGAP